MSSGDNIWANFSSIETWSNWQGNKGRWSMMMKPSNCVRVCMYEQTLRLRQEHLEKSFLIFLFITHLENEPHYTNVHRSVMKQASCMNPPATSHQSRDHFSRPGGAMAVASWLPPPPPPPRRPSPPPPLPPLHFSNGTGVFLFFSSHFVIWRITLAAQWLWLFIFFVVTVAQVGSSMQKPLDAATLLWLAVG